MTNELKIKSNKCGEKLCMKADKCKTEESKKKRYVAEHFEDTTSEVDFYKILRNKPVAIQLLAQRKPNLIVPKKGLPDTGTRPDGGDFFQDALELKALNERSMLMIKTEHPVYWNELGGGDPMKLPPFPGLSDTIVKLFNSDRLSQYPTTEGDFDVRSRILGYLRQEKFSPELTENNIVFSVSTTHAFNLLCTLILRPFDVVLFEAPTYGLFTFSPERVGGITRFFPLKRDENWSIEPRRLEGTIDEINEELKILYKDKVHYTPKVSMVYQSNPQNPIGRVISEKDRNRLKGVLDVCHRKGAFYIDDLIYKDLSYEKDVFPAMGIKGFESDVIALLGVSKSYGLAGIRSGIIVADEMIIRGIRDLLFQTIDSPSQLQTEILGEVFNCSRERNKKYTSYFMPLINEYKHRFAILKAGISGITMIDALEEQISVCDDLKRYYNDSDKEKKWLSGTPFIKLAEGCDPESGFFALLDFTELIGMNYKSSVLHNEEDIMMYFYKTMKIKYLPGAYMAWPDKKQCIARISFAVERTDIIFFVQCLQEAVEKLGNTMFS